MKFFNKICFLLFFVLLGNFAFIQAGNAAPAQEARQALESSINQILNDMKTPQFANPQTRSQILPQMENVVRHIFDFNEFSSRTVGPRWKTFTPEEKERFSNAFANLLFTTYLNKITSYNGEQIAYTGDSVSEKGNRVEIKTVITMKDGRKIPVSYRMLPKDNSWRVYDVIIENISLVKNYRSQFQNILNTASPAELISRVEAKAKEVASQGPDKSQTSN